jgi:hypothetical protein
MRFATLRTIYCYLSDSLIGKFQVPGNSSMFDEEMHGRACMALLLVRELRNMGCPVVGDGGGRDLRFIQITYYKYVNFSLAPPTDPWRNGSASDSRSEGCVFDSRRVQSRSNRISFFSPSLFFIFSCRSLTLLSKILSDFFLLCYQLVMLQAALFIRN